MNGDDSIDRYLSGQALIGDDYGPEDVARWFDDEREAYADLGAAERTRYRYDYHALNWRHGFGHIDPKRRFHRACGFGSAYGDELMPLRSRIDHITIIDSSRRFQASVLGGIDADFIAAQANGRIDSDGDRFDLITCLGVLHHIPNVSFVVSELGRCLQPGGLLLLREPTTSMGDWRRPRPGLTVRERGLPSKIFRSIIDGAGLIVQHHAWCVFPPLAALLGRFGVSSSAHATTVLLDDFLCRMTANRWTYHRTKLVQKFAPASEFFVCTKPL
jgi:SAM-dependent methyltransferase